ncbi:hypothetical protein [Vitreimonas flagellata]|uniref:hypothetical protein n=1 Tax=Vitreimonas flagellata TaxID=2560861 RepID=UPI001074FBC2|nr:hypothetical protein [Vitreimonas flagellata]
MRFALLATSVAAVVAVPLAVHASGPQMSRNEFLAAVECVAAAPNAEFSDAKYQLNAEARRQSPEIAAAARALALQAVNGAGAEDGSMMTANESAPCAGVALIAGANAYSAA